MGLEKERSELYSQNTVLTHLMILEAANMATPSQLGYSFREPIPLNATP